MRYPYFALTVVFLLGACNQDPTAPTITPPVDVSRHVPPPEPNGHGGSCQLLSVSDENSGFEALKFTQCLNRDVNRTAY